MALRFIIKSGLAYSAVYYTRNLGVWGNNIESEKLYNELKDMASPYVNSLEKKLPFDVPAIPPSGEIRFLAIHYYNNAVKSTFNFITMLPCYTGQLIKKTKDAIDKSLEAPAAKN